MSTERETIGAEGETIPAQVGTITGGRETPVLQYELKILGAALLICLGGIVLLNAICAYVRCDVDPFGVKVFERFAEMILIAFCTAIRGPRV